MQFSFSNQIIFCAARDAKNCRKRTAFPAVFSRFHAFRERREVLFHELRRFGPEALSVEIFERPGGGVKGEPQPPRAERLLLFAVGAVVLFAAVFPVAEERAPGMAELRADLVRAPGDKAAQA